jgi:hypothetical protein
MAFEFGPSGRRRLQEIVRSGPPDQRRLATAALASKSRYEVETEVQVAATAANLTSRLRIVPQGSALPAGLGQSIAQTLYCRTEACVVTLVDDRRAVVAGPIMKGGTVESALLERNDKGAWSQDIHSRYVAKPPFRPNLVTAPVEVRTVERRQLYIDGKPVGEVFE